VAVWADLASIPVLYTAFFLFGTGETLADSASVALLPGIVPTKELARANSRLLGTYLVGNQLLAPPPGPSGRGRCGPRSPRALAGCGTSGPCGCWPSAWRS
jgi:hypothetical protein